MFFPHFFFFLFAHIHCIFAPLRPKAVLARTHYVKTDVLIASERKHSICSWVARWCEVGQQVSCLLTEDLPTGAKKKPYCSSPLRNVCFSGFFFFFTIKLLTLKDYWLFGLSSVCIFVKVSHLFCCFVKVNNKNKWKGLKRKLKSNALVKVLSKKRDREMLSNLPPKEVIWWRHNKDNDRSLDVSYKNGPNKSTVTKKLWPLILSRLHKPLGRPQTSTAAQSLPPNGMPVCTHANYNIVAKDPYGVANQSFMFHPQCSMFAL